MKAVLLRLTRRRCPCCGEKVVLRFPRSKLDMPTSLACEWCRREVTDAVQERLPRLQGHSLLLVVAEVLQRLIQWRKIDQPRSPRTLQPI